MWHVAWAGGVCLNILREDWRPVLDVNAVIYGLIQLFGHDVNSEEPLNREAAALLQTDRTQVGGAGMIEWCMGNDVYAMSLR